MLTTDETSTIEILREAINLRVTPLTKSAWKATFQHCGFRNVDVFSGEMNLLSPKGLIYDEGVLGAMKIVGNALKAENRYTLKKMFQTLNDPNSKLGFVAVCSQK